MKLGRWVFVAALLLVSGVVLFGGEVYSSEQVKKDASDVLRSVVEQTLGKAAQITRIEEAENSPVPNWKQIRVWIESVYGETPVLFYTTGDGKFIFAGSLFSDAGENLTRKGVGETIPKFVDNARMDLNENYMVGKKDAKVHAVLWIGLDPFSKQIFDVFYELYQNNKEAVALYFKFFPRTEQDMEKMNTLTCFKGEAMVEALKTMFAAAPGWGSKEDLDVLKKTGDLNACDDDLIMRNIKIAAALKLPLHPCAFVNSTLLIDKVTKENIVKLSGSDLK